MRAIPAPYSSQPEVYSEEYALTVAGPAPIKIAKALGAMVNKYASFVR